jgi:hypothetical protein
MEAETRDSLTTHRLLIEQALKRRNLPPALRRELEEELRRILVKEVAAANPVLFDACEEEDDEEEGEREGGDSGSEGGCGDGGGQQGAGGGDSGGGMGHGDGGAVNEDSGLAGFETIALLFFLAEQDVVIPPEDVPAQDIMPQASMPEVVDVIEDFPVAAVTLLFSREEKIAQVHEPYTLDAEGKPDSPGDLLPALERHAAARGAHIMQLKVHADAVELFRQKGYVPLGKIVTHRGAPMQQMRRVLGYNVSAPVDMS